MRKILLASVFALAIPIGAHADVMISDMLSGTGDNVTFQSLNGNLAIGSFNGQNQGLVDFSCLAGCTGFVGAANGNDIKIQNTTDLKVQVFNSAGTTVLPTATDVFSLKGTGDVHAVVTANEVGGGTKVFTFDLGNIDPNAQSGFTLTAINGETISQFAVVDTTVGGNITDFEHYRIDVAASAVPGPVVGAGLPGLVASLMTLLGLNVSRRRRAGGLAV
jgi:hypothetical protein